MYAVYIIGRKYNLFYEFKKWIFAYNSDWIGIVCEFTHYK